MELCEAGERFQVFRIHGEDFMEDANALFEVSFGGRGACLPVQLNDRNALLNVGKHFCHLEGVGFFQRCGSSRQVA